MPDAIARLRQSILSDYAESVGLPRDARYFGGARLRPVVPLDAAVGGYFVLGAYPSARFEAVGEERDVPVADNLGPFEPERYFDGQRIRVQASAKELDDYYLKPLDISRSDCWITDLVKVFLFKPGHRAKYERLGVATPPGYERERFHELGVKSLPWIEREIALAKPRLVITLGAEVTGIVRGVGEKEAVSLLGPSIGSVRYGGVEAPTVHLAHPGIVMRGGSAESKNPWPKRHTEEHIPKLKAALDKLRSTGR